MAEPTAWTLPVCTEVIGLWRAVAAELEAAADASPGNAELCRAAASVLRRPVAPR